MPDLWELVVDSEDTDDFNKYYNVFYYQGEFYLHDRLWNIKGLSQAEEFEYFDDTDECLNAMKDIAPWHKWRIVDSS